MIKLSVLFFWFSAVTLINKLWCNTHFSVLQTKIIVPVMREFIRFWFIWYVIYLYYLILVKLYSFHLSIKKNFRKRKGFHPGRNDIHLAQIGIHATCHSISFASFGVSVFASLIKHLLLQKELYACHSTKGFICFMNNCGDTSICVQDHNSGNT